MKLTLSRTSQIVVFLVLISIVVAACQDITPEAVVNPTVAIENTPVVEPTLTAAPEASATEAPTELPEPTATAEPTPEPTLEPTDEPITEADPVLPPAVVYNLGDTTIVQPQFADDSAFYNMPVRLEGVIAVPDSMIERAPVALILHGNHFGCPFNEARGTDVWPCDPEDEQANYLGYSYLVSELAASGYVALAPNINAQFTLGFGEEQTAGRLSQLIDLHLTALSEANAGNANEFGVDLAGRADMSRLAVLGHSQGGELGNRLIREKGWDQPMSFAEYGYGPVRGVLLVAPSQNTVGATGTNVPLATILPQCDGDVSQLDGQAYYDTVRMNPANESYALGVLLKRANHNGFNTILGPDWVLPQHSPDCELLLAPEAQQSFLADFTTDFLATLFAEPDERLAARARLGLDLTEPVSDELYGMPVLISSLAEERLTLTKPETADELAGSLVGGEVTLQDVSATFCPEGYFAGELAIGLEVCQRANINHPGNPTMWALSWETPEAAVRWALPEAVGDISAYTMISLRAALDPLSELNRPGVAQTFTLRLTDTTGNSVDLLVSPDEPALAFPNGEPFVMDDMTFFPGHAYPATVRLPLPSEGIDLSRIAEVAILFDQIDTGAIFLSDVEFVRPPQLIGAYSTLLENSDGANDSLRGVGRFSGESSCTGTFVDVGGGADAPAYVLTNGHCAQPWAANDVYVDLPADGMSITFNAFVDSQNAQLEIPAQRVAYSTMKGRDLAIVELSATVGELQDQGIVPLPIATEELGVPATIRVAGIPVSGVPLSLAYLREETCLATERADLFEFQWHFTDTYRTSCQDIYGGSSGSPVFAGDEPAIVGLINTTTIGGVTPCGLGMPCEVTAEGTAAFKDRSYMVPIWGLSACFDADGRFDLAAEECSLDDGRQLLISGYPVQPVQPTTTDVDGNPIPVTWNAQLSGDLPFYRIKLGPANVIDCRDENGYREVKALANEQSATGSVGPEDGSYLLCVLAGESATVDDTWQSAQFATLARIELDTQPPTIRPALSVLPGGEDVRFEPIFVSPELANFQLAIEPLESSTCEDPDAYFPYRRIPVVISADQLPAVVCVIASDVAGNWSEPWSYPLDFRPKSDQ